MTDSQPEPQASGLLAEALALAACGWAVFPCREYGTEDDWKRPYWAPDIPNGHLDATTGPGQIRAWWERWPHALIGAPVPPALLVLDLDPRNGGQLDALPPLPATLTAWSGRGDGGRHFYFLRPPGAFTSTRLPEGWDLKVNGYCIVPPSPHPATGQPYTWDERDPVPLPAAVRELLRPPRRRPFRQPASRGTARGDGHHLVEHVAQQQHGKVNNILYWAAKRAALEGILTDELAAALVTAAGHAAGAHATPAGERQSWRTIGSARKAAL
jgi:Bifunctional DNA primase/polymerase, N-terminal